MNPNEAKGFDYIKPSRRQYEKMTNAGMVTEFVERLSIGKGQYSVNADGLIVAGCPDCGRVMLIKDHAISDAGGVTPSVVSETKECSFHDHVVLKNWDKNRRYPLPSKG